MSVETSEMAKRIRNLVVVAIAAVLSIAVILGLQTRSPAASLSEMAETRRADRSGYGQQQTYPNRILCQLVYQLSGHGPRHSAA